MAGEDLGGEHAPERHAWHVAILAGEHAGISQVQNWPVSQLFFGEPFAFCQNRGGREKSNGFPSHCCTRRRNSSFCAGHREDSVSEKTVAGKLKSRCRADISGGMTEQQLFDEVNETVHRIKWNPQLNGGWLVELMGREIGSTAWQQGEWSDAGLSEAAQEEMRKVWGRIPKFPHIWFAHSYKLTPAVRLMEVLWELHQRGMTPTRGLGFGGTTPEGLLVSGIGFARGKRKFCALAPILKFLIGHS